MGVKGLFSYINKVCHNEGIERPLSYFEYKTFIIDVSIYMYKLKHVMNMSVIDNFKRLIDNLIKNKNSVILIIDGNCQEDKYFEIQSRKEQRINNLELIKNINKELWEIDETEENDIYRTNLLEKKHYLTTITTCVTQEERIKLHNFLNDAYSDTCTIYYVENEEADVKIAKLFKKHQSDAVVMSDDTDMFLYGCKVVVMNYNPSKLTVHVYILKNILDTLDVSRDELIQICIMTGTDYLSPFHENSPLPKISITQMFSKFYNFKEHMKRRSQYVAKLKHNRKQLYTNFIDFMCFVYWKNKEELNSKLWQIYRLYYKT